jgi:hypothetical protein
MAQTQDMQDNNIDQLETAALGHFTATPAAIGPFGNSELSWSVTGTGAFRVELNGTQVGRSGKQTVRPMVTTPYRLEAHAGTAVKTLATVTLQVDTSSCALVQSSFTDPRAEFLTFVTNAVLGSDPTLSIPPPDPSRNRGQPITHEPTIELHPGYMRIVMHLTKSVADVPDPRIDVVIECGLQIDQDTGALQAINPSVQGSVNEPWWVDLVPALGIIVSIGAGDAQQKLPMQFQPLIDGISGFLSLIFPIDTSRQRYQRVSIPGDPASPFVQLVACSKPLDTHLTDLGNVTAVTGAQVTAP